MAGMGRLQYLVQCSLELLDPAPRPGQLLQLLRHLGRPAGRHSTTALPTLPPSLHTEMN